MELGAVSADLADAHLLCAAALNRDDRPGEIAELLLGRPTGVSVGAYDVGSLIGVAAGATRTRADGVVTGHLDLVAVDAAHRRGGVGRALVEHVTQWCAARGSTEMWWGNDAPTYAWPGVEHGYLAARGLAVAMGCEPVREATNLTVRLDGADLATDEDERRLAASGLEIGRLESDRDGFLEWVATFGGTWAAEAAQALERSSAGCHVARRATSWVGFACYGGNRRGWFGPMGTADSERGRGVGGVLLRRCLADQRDAGVDAAQIAWVGPVGFYERAVGAVVQRRFTLYRARL